MYKQIIDEAYPSGTIGYQVFKSLNTKPYLLYSCGNNYINIYGNDLVKNAEERFSYIVQG